MMIGHPTKLPKKFNILENCRKSPITKQSVTWPTIHITRNFSHNIHTQKINEAWKWKPWNHMSSMPGWLIKGSTTWKKSFNNSASFSSSFNSFDINSRKFQFIITFSRVPFALFLYSPQSPHKQHVMTSTSARSEKSVQHKNNNNKKWSEFQLK